MRPWRRSAAPAVLGILLSVLASTSAQAVVLPPELVALEQQMTQLHVTSERFSARLVGYCASHAGPNGCKRRVPPSLLLDISGQVGSSPHIGAFHVNSAGKHARVRLIGNTVYTYRPKVARFDGGRPWVRNVGLKPDDLLGLDPTGLLSDALGGSVGNYRHLVGLLGEAQSVVDAGSVLIAGQQTTEFDATFDGGQPILEERKGGTLKLFLAASGLPVRSLMTTSGGDFYTLRLTINTPAINVPPLRVKAPPPRKTIDEARLEQLEARRKGGP